MGGRHVTRRTGVGFEGCWRGLWRWRLTRGRKEPRCKQLGRQLVSTCEGRQGGGVLAEGEDATVAMQLPLVCAADNMVLAQHNTSLYTRQPALLQVHVPNILLPPPHPSPSPPHLHPLPCCADHLSAVSRGGGTDGQAGHLANSSTCTCGWVTVQTGGLSVEQGTNHRKGAVCRCFEERSGERKRRGVRVCGAVERRSRDGNWP